MPIKKTGVMMGSDRLTKRMIDVQKSTFEMMLNTSGSIQEHSGRATQAFFEHMAVLPREGVKSMGYWMDSVKQTRNEFNMIIRDSYDNWENLFEKTMRFTEESARRSQQRPQQHERRKG
jgi:hypothetical protein